MVARHRPPSTPSAQECRSRPLPAPCSSASRRWLLLGRVPCRPQPPHSVLPAGPAPAALCSRPGLVELFPSFWTGLQPKPPPQPPRSASNEEDDLITSLPLVR